MKILNLMIWLLDKFVKVINFKSDRNWLSDDSRLIIITKRYVTDNFTYTLPLYLRESNFNSDLINSITALIT